MHRDDPRSGDLMFPIIFGMQVGQVCKYINSTIYRVNWCEEKTNILMGSIVFSLVVLVGFEPAIIGRVTRKEIIFVVF